MNNPLQELRYQSEKKEQNAAPRAGESIPTILGRTARGESERLMEEDKPERGRVKRLI